MFKFLSRKQRLSLTIAISFSFFVAEISAGFYTRSLALVADAFHYLNDLIGFIVALIAVQATERGVSPQGFSFGWARAQLLGAFFNGVFLLALGLSIFLQSIERFISLQRECFALLTRTPWLMEGTNRCQQPPDRSDRG